jgi:hypothetical protein
MPVVGDGCWWAAMAVLCSAIRAELSTRDTTVDATGGRTVVKTRAD